MINRLGLPFALCASVFLSNSSALAQGQIVAGHVILAEGHINAGCGRVKLRLADNNVMWFRIPSGATDTILAVALTAFGTQKQVQIAYDGTTSGCGTEPQILYISAITD